jgi:small subunit ribosomal protein S20
MPNHKSAIKRVKQNEKRRAINRGNRGSLRTQIKKLRLSLAENNKEQSQELLSPTVSMIDKAVNKGIIHKNTAARYKSRLTSHIAKLA